MPEVDLDYQPAALHKDRDFVEDLVFGLKSIPHLPRALTRGFNEPGISDEEKEIRKRALAEAAQWILPALVTGGAGVLVGRAAPVVTAIIGAASEAIGAGTAAALKDEEVLPAAMVGGAAGGVFGAIPGMIAAKAGSKMTAEIGEQVAKHVDDLPDSRMVRTPDGGVTLSDEPYKIKTPEAPPTATDPEPDIWSTLGSKSPSSLTGPSGRIVYPRGPLKSERIHMPAGQMDLFGEGLPMGQQELFGPGFSGKTTAKLSGAQSKIVSDVDPPKGGKVGGGAGFAPDQGIAATNAAARTAMEDKKATPAFLRDVSNLVHRAVSPARTVLMRMGDAGTVLAKGMDEAFTSWRMKSGDDIEKVERLLSPFGKDDRVHIGEIMEGLTTPKSAAHADVAEKLSDIYEGYAKEAHDLGMKEYFGDGDIREFTARRNYFTHYYDPKALKRATTPGTKEHRHAMAWISGHTQARTEREKMALLRRVMEPRVAEFRTGPINHPRSNIMAGLPYEKDPLKVMMRYIYQVRKRLEVARKFGADDTGADALIKQIGEEGGEPHVAKRIWAAFNDQLPREYDSLVKATSTYNILTLLSTSGLVQPAQLLNTAAVTGYGNLIKAIGMAQTKGGRDWARRTGSYVHETLQEFAGAETSKATQVWLRNIIGLEPLDKANRVVSSLAGRLYAEETAGKFATKATPKLAKRLEDLGLDPIQVAAQKGVLTDEQLRKAAFRTSMDTQFASDILDLPESRNSWSGRMIYQFKPFTLQQTYWLFDKDKGIFTKFRKALLGQSGGDAAPFLRFAAGLGPVGYAIGEMVRGFKGRPAPDDPKLRMIENLAMVGAFGVYYDTWRSLSDGPGGFLSLLTGPAAGEIANYVGEIPKAVQGNPDALLKHVLKRVPGIGQPLSNYWAYPRE